MGRFDGSVAIVTGAGRGLGADYARYFAQDGAAVVVADIKADQARAVAAEIDAAGGKALGLEVDVANVESTEQLAAATLEAFGRVDFLVNNAALYGDLVRTPFLETDPSYFDVVMAVNVKGPWLCTRAVAPTMKKQRFGRVINISSVGAWYPGAMYHLSKLAVHQVTNSSAMELGPFGITVNSIAPGAMWSEATAVVSRGLTWEQAKDAVKTDPGPPPASMPNPIGRYGRASDIYGAIRWLCGEDAPWVTAQVISPNGGSHPRF